jgi:hypothetical protein
MPVIPAAGRLRQENIEFKASLGYRARVYLKNQKLKTKPKKELLCTQIEHMTKK